MCGIAGIFHGCDGRRVDPLLLQRMNDAIIHRGPDNGDVYIDHAVGLAHRRLSIIDVAGSDQPMFNEDGSVVLVYNGEIYNFKEVREELLACGHQFKTSGDTEVVVHGWEEWGEACVERFRGMFAFALWDKTRKMLFLARDRLGIKPLYLTELADGTMAFGSELKTLLPIPELERQIDLHAIEDYFAFGYIPDPKTILKNVRRLKPGETVLVEQGKPARSRIYWAYDPAASDMLGDESLWCDQLLERMEEAVRIRLVAEVPLGAFLSGGIDSSTVVALMARTVGHDRVNTCSIAFKDPRFDEAAYAAQVAQQYATEHHVEAVDVDDFGLVDRLGWVYDEPFADPSAIPTYRLCELARTKVTVALSGDGGDELLAGYARYRFHMAEERARGLLPLSIRRPLFGTLGKLYPKADWAPKILRAKSTFESLAMDSCAAYFHTVSLMGNTLRNRLFSADLKHALGGYQALEVFKEHLAPYPSLDPLSMATFLDIKTYLPGDILTKVDRASMAHSLEVRVPLIDHKLVEWMARLPNSVKLKGAQGKYLLKKTMEPHLSNDLLYRKKMGFSVPIAHWFRGPLRERVAERILSGPLRESGLFSGNYLQDLVAHHQSGRRDNSEYLWALLMFDASMEQIGIN